MELQFEKFEGLGNDFVLLDLARNPDHHLPETAAVRRICDRHFGVGADGVLCFSVEPGPNVVRMVYFNADGGRAETCFNGLRCIALHAVRSGFIHTGSDFSIVTDAGVVTAKVDDDLSVSTGFILPEDAEPVERTLDFPFGRLTGSSLSLGNPHFVTWCDGESLQQLNDFVAHHGEAVEKSEQFPGGVNLEAVCRHNPNEVELAVWERGVGVTLACGSGATAAVLAGVHSGRLTSGKPIGVRMTGGSLHITVSSDLKRATVRGPARYVFSGVLSLNEEDRW